MDQKNCWTFDTDKKRLLVGLLYVADIALFASMVITHKKNPTKLNPVETAISAAGIAGLCGYWQGKIQSETECSYKHR